MSVWPPYEVLMPLAPWEPPAVLAQALDSLMQQSLLPQQLVLSVDGSLPSGLNEAVATHWLLPIRVLCGPGGEGVGPVLARGLQECRCELILRADADDLSLPDRAARQLLWMTLHPEVVAGSGWIQEFDEGCGQSNRVRFVPTGRVVQYLVGWRNPLNHPAVVLRRSGVLSVGGYHHQPGFEDYDLWLRLIQRYGKNAIDNLPEILVKVRIGNEHLSRRRGLLYAKAEVQFFVRCVREGHMSWAHIMLLLLFRLPWRLLPAPALAATMRTIRILDRISTRLTLLNHTL